MASKLRTTLCEILLPQIGSPQTTKCTYFPPSWNHTIFSEFHSKGSLDNIILCKNNDEYDIFNGYIDVWRVFKEFQASGGLEDQEDEKEGCRTHSSRAAKIHNPSARSS